MAQDPDWDDAHERAFPIFRRRFEEMRETAGEEAMRNDFAVFKDVNWHHAHMRPLLRRLERELLRTSDT
jgi:hypothetical protein